MRKTPLSLLTAAGAVGWMEESGHLPMLEEPDTYARAIAEFARCASAKEDHLAR